MSDDDEELPAIGEGEQDGQNLAEQEGNFEMENAGEPIYYLFNRRPIIQMLENLGDDENAMLEGSPEYDGSPEPEDNSDSEEEAISFDTSLPAQHQYLGETQQVGGRTISDEDDFITLPILQQYSATNVILSPSQMIPLNIHHPTDISMLKNVINTDKTFGIVSDKDMQDRGIERLIDKYGTTAEIFEYQEEDEFSGIKIKAMGRQRFRVIEIRREITGCIVAKVKISPEIRMGDPLDFCQLDSLNKFCLPKYDNEQDKSELLKSKSLVDLYTKKYWKMRKYNSMISPWPSWVYNQYDEKQVAQTLINELANNTNIGKYGNLKISKDPVELSNWAAINLPLQDKDKLKLLTLNSSLQRMKYILSVISRSKVLVCSQCEMVISSTSDIFSMSVEGPQGMFVNDGGYVHEMFTTKSAKGLAYFGGFSTRYSWFPGYGWRIANCANCQRHIGWKFSSVNFRTKPRKFYGITRKSVKSLLVGGDHGGNSDEEAT